MDELKNAMKEKTDKNLDRMVKKTNFPFTTSLGIPFTVKVLPSPVRFIRWSERPFRSYSHFQNDPKFATNL